jgi:hypothetical protein
MANSALTTLLCNFVGRFSISENSNLLFESIRAAPNTEVKLQIGEDPNLIFTFKIPSTGVLDLGIAFPIQQGGRIDAITFLTSGNSPRPFLLNYRQQGD